MTAPTEIAARARMPIRIGSNGEDPPSSSASVEVTAGAGFAFWAVLAEPLR